MRKFDKVLAEDGYIKPYGDIDLWYKDDKIWFLFAYNYPKGFLESEKYDLKHATGELERNCLTVVSKKENMSWILPMTAADYLFHKNHKFTEEELKYSKMAMEINPELKKTAFSRYLQDKL